MKQKDSPETKRRLQAFKIRIPEYRKNPILFCQEMLKFYPDDWQASTLMDLANNPRVSDRSGQGVGKTGLEAATALWFLSCFPYPKVICTAPTTQQLHDVLWAEINKWQSKSPVLKRILKWTKTKIYMKNYEERWFATARTATKPENMQGFHEDYMLFIVDEASGVADPIMEAILGTLSGEFNKILMCGNPTKTSGVFYDSHNKDRADYKTRKVSCLDSPRTSKDNIAMLKRKYGEGSDVWRVRVEGEFPRGESDTFISLEVAEFAAKDVILEPTGDILTIGCDVARFGDDETSIYAGIGPVTVGQHHHFKKDTMVTAGWVLNLIKELLPQYPEVVHVRIRIDDTGVGGGVTDRLNEVIAEEGLPYEVIPINNGSSSLDEHYGNLGAEMWAYIKGLLEQNMSNYMNNDSAVLQLPDDDVLTSQLTTRKWSMTSKGKILLESKKDMKKRGLKSPDRADAYVLTFGEYLLGAPQSIMLPTIGGVSIKR
ncbi:DEAD/DEAH box helicase family protein [Paenibacillus sp. F4]|uniref:DEAD/DEAH box helicase family protein n=1 Tax=Paenibacillus sp. F4 TaxID=357385 RepID=UPI000C9ECA9E|nr:DEAD/DEAH box helicase family protein [Paenibacillus sp. F4]PNQ81620.1 terminase B [Paenibacillus sp. F4]